MGELIKSFLISTSVLLVCFWVLKKWMWKPLGASLDRRVARVRKQQLDIKKRKQKMVALRKTYQKRLADIDIERQRMLSQTQKQIQQQLEEARVEAKRIGEQLVTEIHEQAEAEKKQLLQEFEQQLLSLLGVGLDQLLASVPTDQREKTIVAGLDIFERQGLDQLKQMLQKV